MAKWDCFVCYVFPETEQGIILPAEVLLDVFVKPTAVVRLLKEKIKGKNWAIMALGIFAHFVF